MAGANVLEFTEQNFQSEVLGSSKPVLVDFWAPWCGPCRAIAPTIDKLADDYQGKVAIGKVNTDDQPSIAESYGISAIPTVLLFKGGQIVQRFVGAVNRDKLASALDAHL